MILEQRETRQHVFKMVEPVYTHSAKPVHSGSLWLIQSNTANHPAGCTRSRVILSIYNSNFGKYGIVSVDKVMLKDCGYIHLKNAHVRELSTSCGGLYGGLKHGFQIVHPFCADGKVVTFATNSWTDVRDWMNAITCVVNPPNRLCRLYTVFDDVVDGCDDSADAADDRASTTPAIKPTSECVPPHSAKTIHSARPSILPVLYEEMS